ncbi:hypothetical protein [Acidovorax sp.]|uniref:hypothetical protein n=1 Tax=Acidovorax sp. TaxID=1872122 RepID=UPI002ACD4D52|nr:hypothetical protein [Acidovorax sp.]MDZ7862883.1 hypothetical protein [Acidovorax sp.]
MKTLSNTSGNYGMLQGADSAGDSRVFGISAVIAVLVVSCVVAFKMAAPEIKAALASQLPAATQLVSSQSAPSVDASAPRAVVGEH